jgi:hypothetical protein
MQKALICTITCLLLTACGGDTYVKVQGTTTISKGQELADLQRALEEGAVSRLDYDRIREKILDRPH